MYFIAVIILIIILALLVITLFYDGLCDKYNRAFDEYGLDLSKRQIVQQIFSNFSDEDKTYILKEC